jgi:selenoprotein W-related protein
VSATQDLLFHYQHVIEELRLVMGGKGIFDVEVDGKLLYSKHGEGRHAKPGEVLERFRKLVPSNVKEYGA